MKEIAIKNGLMAGIAGVILMLVLWLINPRYYINYQTFVGLIVVIYFMYRAGKEVRDQNGGYISLGEIFKPLFITIVFGTLIYALFQYVMFKFIDTGLVEVQKQIAIEGIQKVAEYINSEEIQENLDEAIAEIEDKDFSITFMQVIKSWFVNLIFGAIIALIQAAIMKKNPPVDYVLDEEL